MAKVPNPLQNIKIQGLSETIKISNRFGNLEKNYIPKNKTPTIREML